MLTFCFPLSSEIYRKKKGYGNDITFVYGAFEELSIHPLKPSTLLRDLMILSYFGLTKMRNLVKDERKQNKVIFNYQAILFSAEKQRICCLASC